jgi:tryptophan synthase beta chain
MIAIAAIVSVRSAAAQPGEFYAGKTLRILVGVEAGGTGSALGHHSATLSVGRPGVLHGNYSMLLYDDDGQIQETHSVSAGLDYPGVGPEHALLKLIERVEYVAASDDEALAALDELCASEGILPALESSHALAGAKRWAKQHPRARILVGLSGRGDKDMPILARYAANKAQPADDRGAEGRDGGNGRHGRDEATRDGLRALRSRRGEPKEGRDAAA